MERSRDLMPIDVAELDERRTTALFKLIIAAKRGNDVIDRSVPG